MHIIFIDADACPVKNEIYRVAKRYRWSVKVVANATMRVPIDDQIEMIVQRGFGAADDWIAQQCGPGDAVVTADIPLAARCLEKRSRVIDARGKAFTEADIGSALAVRELMDALRQIGEVTGGPSAMTPRDRSKFLGKLDETIVALKKEFPPAAS